MILFIVGGFASAPEGRRGERGAFDVDFLGFKLEFCKCERYSFINDMSMTLYALEWEYVTFSSSVFLNQSGL